ncbi:hypothetical protein JR316_0002452 [Psilocybe cubensis]|uniref:Uncharacterized protein n=2 Tax=Psilocybe cubensis TaxID=181762 RepID=A0ACB8HD14_PSICU|nr:hypothetical protein JR316_0002452 [Psilocybe cubensis]KAH9485542.1 hypothetical protein JR316_0002452 [Psilocybe cubensis]
MVIVAKEQAAPTEVYKRVPAKTTPYSVCMGCNGSIQGRACVHPGKATWHSDCYDENETQSGKQTVSAAFAKVS